MRCRESSVRNGAIGLAGMESNHQLTPRRRPRVISPFNYGEMVRIGAGSARAKRTYHVLAFGGGGGFAGVRRSEFSRPCSVSPRRRAVRLGRGQSWRRLPGPSGRLPRRCTGRFSPCSQFSIRRPGYAAKIALVVRYEHIIQSEGVVKRQRIAPVDPSFAHASPYNGPTGAGRGDIEGPERPMSRELNASRLSPLAGTGLLQASTPYSSSAKG